MHVQLRYAHMKPFIGIEIERQAKKKKIESVNRQNVDRLKLFFRCRLFRKQSKQNKATERQQTRVYR